MDQDRLTRLIEFFIIGVAMGVTEDLIAIVLATNAEIRPHVIGIVVLVAVPFAILSELVVDSSKFVYFENVAAWLASQFQDR